MTNQPESFSLPIVRDALEDAVYKAGVAISEIISSGHIRVEMKFGEGPVSEADHAADEILQQQLIPLIPGGHWLSEESKQSHPLVAGEPTWVVDPLDGTREFQQGLPEFGVSVGLFIDNRLVLGAIALPPLRQEGDWSVLSGILEGSQPEARRDGSDLTPVEDNDEVGRVVISRHDYERRHLQLHIPFEVYPAGSSVLKLAQVAIGEAGVYLSTQPRSVWDVAGGAAVLAAAGGVLLKSDGNLLELSPQQVRIPAFVAAAPKRGLALLNTIVARS